MFFFFLSRKQSKGIRKLNQLPQEITSKLSLSNLCRVKVILKPFKFTFLVYKGNQTRATPMGNTSMSTIFVSIN